MGSIILVLAVLTQQGGADDGLTLDSLPRAQPLEPAEAARTIRALHGFRVDLLAAEPLVTDPVAAAYDEDGRLYVAEMNDYPYIDPANDRPFQESADPPGGRVRLLIDNDDDGVFDETHIFAEDLSWPAGIAVWKGGIYVTAAPEILYLKDTDGDHKADVRQVAFTGFRKYNVQALLNNPTWGLDHGLYAAASGNGGQVRPADDPDAKPIAVVRRDFRFEPATGRFAAISGGARFGNTFDDWGNRFLCDIRNPAQHVVLPARYLERSPDLPAPRALHDAALSGDNLPVYRISPPEPWRELRARRWAAAGKVMPRSELIGAGVVTSSSGVTIYRGDAYPEPFRGNLVLGEVAGNLVHRQVIEPDGVTFRSLRADEGVEFVASTDIWFRPVNFANAPDGTLHILDMYRETIEHPWSIPDDIKARLDLRSGSDRGRIYRLTPPDFQRRPTPRLSQAATAELVALLEHPNGWHRDTAHRLLFERQDRTAVEPLRRLLRESKSPLGRLHALWSLEGLGDLADDDLTTALDDAAPGLREHAVRLAEGRLNDVTALRARVLGLADDPEPRVRFQVAFSLGELDDPAIVAPLAALARRDADDVWMRTAVLSSAAGCAGELFSELIGDAGLATDEGGRALLRTLAGMLGSRVSADEAGAALTALAGSPIAQGDDLDAALDLTLSLGDSLRRRKIPLFAAGNTSEFLARLLRYAETGLADPAAAPEMRARAAALYGHRPLSEALEALAPRLAAGEPPEVQLAAVRALAVHPDQEVAALLLGSWASFTPAVRSDVLQVFNGRPVWIGALLDAIEGGVVHVNQIPPTSRTLLINRAPADAQVRARQLLAGEAPGPRSAAIDRYLSALNGPADAEQGRLVFARECLTCHRLGTEGHDVGPNLSSIQRRTPEEVLVHVLDPNREVAPDFVEYVVALTDGRVATGLIESETATSLGLKRAEGVAETVLRRDVEAITTTGQSLMPEGLEERITPREMADLIAFLLELQR